jgi:class 3 adenylate cyclase
VSGRTELPSGLVTFMFTDIEGSTRLARMLGDDYGSVLGAHRGVVRAALSDSAVSSFSLRVTLSSWLSGTRGSALAACVAAQRADCPHTTGRVPMGLHTAHPGRW